MSKRINFLVQNDQPLNGALGISTECSFFLLNIAVFFFFFYLISYLGTRDLYFTFYSPTFITYEHYQTHLVACQLVTHEFTSILLHLSVPTALMNKIFSWNYFVKKGPHYSLLKIDICHKAYKRSANYSASSPEGTDSSFSVEQFPCRSEGSDIKFHLFFLFPANLGFRFLRQKLLLAASSSFLKP